MKRTFILGLFFCLGIEFCSAALPKMYSQTYNGKYGQHAINVDAYGEWGRHRLTITDLHYIKDVKKNVYLYTTCEPVEDSIGGKVYIPDIGDIIIEVNGISTQNMSCGKFYSYIDNTDTFTLSISSIRDRKVHVQKFRAIEESSLENYSMSYYDGSHIINGKKSYRNVIFLDDYGYYSNFYKRNQLPNNDNVIREIYDKSFDFSRIKTYDYAIVGNDPLNDTEILREVSFFRGRLRRDTKKPDIIFTIAKNADESINTTYIPPTSRIINTGSTTTPDYNYITHTYDYITKHNYQTIREGGYTQTTKTADIFLEITALDAKKINDKSINYAPIIWQMTAKRHVLNYDFNINDEYRGYASWALFPILDRYNYREATLYIEGTGMTADVKNPAIVADVEKGSRADIAGVKVGDEIIKCYYYYKEINDFGPTSGGDNYVTVTNTKVHIKHAYGRKHDRKSKSYGIINYLNDKSCSSWRGYERENDIHLTIKRKGKKMEVTLSPISKTFSREYLALP